MFRFPRDDTGELRVNFGLFDKVVTYKTVERLDDSVAEKVTILCDGLRLDEAWRRAEKLVFHMILVKDIVNRVVGASQLQLFHGHTQKATFYQCFNWECHPFLVRDPRGVGQALVGP